MVLLRERGVDPLIPPGDHALNSLMGATIPASRRCVNTQDGWCLVDGLYGRLSASESRETRAQLKLCAWLWWRVTGRQVRALEIVYLQHDSFTLPGPDLKYLRAEEGAVRERLEGFRGVLNRATPPANHACRSVPNLPGTPYVRSIGAHRQPSPADGHWRQLLTCHTTVVWVPGVCECVWGGGWPRRCRARDDGAARRG